MIIKVIKSLMYVVKCSETVRESDIFVDEYTENNVHALLHDQFSFFFVF